MGLDVGVPRGAFDRRAWLTAGAILLGLALFFAPPGAAAFAGAGLAAAAASLAPPLGLLAALATLPLHLQTRSVGPLAVSFSELMLLAAAAGTGCYWLRRVLAGAPIPSPLPALPASAPRFDATPFDWPISLFLLSALLSLLVTEYLRLSLRELRLLILEPVLAYYLLLAWFPGRAIAWPLGACLGGAVGVALAGLVGLVFGWGTSEAEGVRRLQATYLSANHLGLLLGRALPWLVALAWVGGRWHWVCLGGGLAVSLALLATYSRGAWLGTGAALVVLAALLGGRQAFARVGLALVGVVALGLALWRVERLGSLLQPGGTGFLRLQLWQSALEMVRDHPLLGVGLDNFLYLYQQRYIKPEALAEANLSHPHNLVLDFWLRLGLAGLIAALWLLGKAFVVAGRQLQTTSDRFHRALIAGATASLVDFVVHGLIDNSYFLPDLALIFWLTMAVLAAGCQLSGQRLPNEARAG